MSSISIWSDMARDGARRRRLPPQSRRPGEGRPITPGSDFAKSVVHRAPRMNSAVWVPAFAGTTVTYDGSITQPFLKEALKNDAIAAHAALGRILAPWLQSTHNLQRRLRAPSRGCVACSREVPARRR